MIARIAFAIGFMAFILAIVVNPPQETLLLPLLSSAGLASYALALVIRSELRHNQPKRKTTDGLPVAQFPGLLTALLIGLLCLMVFQANLISEAETRQPSQTVFTFLYPLCALAVGLVTPFWVLNLLIWMVLASLETPHITNRSLRYSKLKGSDFAEPSDARNLLGDVSVSDDGELLDKPKRDSIHD
jgi:hypothetical protein